ncbi:MAG: hypothetical protein M4579_001353 [Chaenotheca gracillima]|nr:MAG: hypothetical protein M4579_001353 [Chaenotheca gracillima]
MASQGREYEIVLLGATGYTGSLTAEYIAKHLPTDLKWAVAGRSEAKLAAIVQKIRTWNPDRPLPAIEVCALGKEELNVLARKTRLVITAVGPFAIYGTPVVEACANNGTHYVDTTGEFPWTLDMIKRYHETAKANGAVMIPQFGIESAPHDLLSWCLVTKIREKFSVGTKEVLFTIDEMSFDVSGGTLATILNFFDQYSMKALLEAGKPWAHSPIKGTETPNPEGLLGVRRDPTLGLLSNSSLTQEANRSVVHRSWGLIGNGTVYGPKFQYREYMRTSGYIAGNIPRLVMSVVMLFLLLPPVRWLARKLNHQPGSGPDVESPKAGNCEFSAVGIADQNVASPDRALATMKYKGTTYQLTGLLVAEAAMTILREKTLASKLGGGLLTPAMLGRPILDRLEKAGVAFETRAL